MGEDLRTRYRTARLVAVVAGLLGMILALATPFLPVRVTEATMSWPQDSAATDVELPLMSQVPLQFRATVPCSAVAEMPGDGDSSTSF